MMDSWVRFSAQSQAKERVFRAAQYACTLLGYTLQRGGARAELLNTIKQLEAHMSLTRKLMRLGNSAEALEAAKRTVHLSDCVLRLCITVAHLNRAMYLPVIMYCGPEKQDCCLNWTKTNGARDHLDTICSHSSST